MICDKCGSDRIMNINGKCSDLCMASYKDLEKDGYVPDGIRIGGGDEVTFSYCLECGMIQDSFPVDEQEVKDAFVSD